MRAAQAAGRRLAALLLPVQQKARLVGLLALAAAARLAALLALLLLPDLKVALLKTIFRSRTEYFS